MSAAQVGATIVLAVIAVTVLCSVVVWLRERCSPLPPPAKAEQNAALVAELEEAVHASEAATAENQAEFVRRLQEYRTTRMIALPGDRASPPALAEGVGRVRREAFMLMIGDDRIDLDSLRVWGNPHLTLAQAAHQLSPPMTIEEGAWLARWIDGELGYHVAVETGREMARLRGDAEPDDLGGRVRNLAPPPPPPKPTPPEPGERYLDL